MPYRTPDTVPNNRTEKGEQPYKDSREAMAQKDAQLHDIAESLEGQHQGESVQERRTRLESEAEERFESIQGSRADPE